MNIGQQLETIKEIICRFAMEKFAENDVDASLASIIMDGAAGKFKTIAHNQLTKEYYAQTEAFERLKAFCNDLDLDAMEKAKEDKHE